MTYVYFYQDDLWHCWTELDGLVEEDGSLVFSGTLKGVGSTKAKARSDYWKNEEEAMSFLNELEFV